MVAYTMITYLEQIASLLCAGITVLGFTILMVLALRRIEENCK